MDKKELLKKIQDVYDRVDNLETTLREAHKEARDIRGLLEELPDSESEIEDDGSEEDGE